MISRRKPTHPGEILREDILLSQGHNMDYIARHYHMDLPLGIISN